MDIKSAKLQLNYFLNLLLANAASPIRPEPRSSIVAGSGASTILPNAKSPETIESVIEVIDPSVHPKNSAPPLPSTPWVRVDASLRRRVMSNKAKVLGSISRPKALTGLLNVPVTEDKPCVYKTAG